MPSSGEAAEMAASEIKDSLETLTGADRLSADAIKDGTTNKFSNDTDRDTWLAGKDTDDLAEGTLNKYNIEQVYPTYQCFDRLDFKVISGNPFSVANNIVYYNGFRYRQEPPADGDTTEVYALLAAGTYDFVFIGATGSLAGIVDLHVDGVKKGTSMDWLQLPSGTYTTKTIPNVELTAGNHQIQLKINGTSGTDYYFTNYRTVIRPS